MTGNRRPRNGTKTIPSVPATATTAFLDAHKAGGQSSCFPSSPQAAGGQVWGSPTAPRSPPPHGPARTQGRSSPLVPKGLHPNLLHPGGLLHCTTTSPAIIASGHTRNKYSLSGNICCTDFSILFSLQRKKNNPFPVCWGHPHGWDLRCAAVGWDRLPAGRGTGRSFLPGGKRKKFENFVGLNN